MSNIADWFRQTFRSIKDFFYEHRKLFVRILLGIVCAVVVFYLLVLITGWI